MKYGIGANISAMGNDLFKVGLTQGEKAARYVSEHPKKSLAIAGGIAGGLYANQKVRQNYPGIRKAENIALYAAAGYGAYRGVRNVRGLDGSSSPLPL